MTVYYNNCFVLISGITSILKEMPNEDELFDLLCGIRHKWYDIGLLLQVRHSVLHEIYKSDDNNETKLKKVIDHWKDTKSSFVNWETVITAVESPVINNKMLADYISQRLKFSKLLLLSNEVVLLILSLSINCIVQTF